MKKALLFALIISILASCSTSNEVVSNKLFQKRKYQKGWHVNSVKKVDKVKKQEITEYEEELVVENETSEDKPVQNQEQSITKSESTNYPVDSKTNSDINTFDLEKEEEGLIIESTNDVESTNHLIIPIETKIDIDQEKSKKVKVEKSTNSSGYSTLLMVILCLFLPPVAVGLLRGWSSTEFYISLVLFLIGWGFLALSAFASLATLVGIVYAFLILFDKI